VLGVAVAGDSVVAAVDTLGGALFGVPLQGAPADDLGGALVYLPR
jgi:hypothetical protein